MGHGMAAVHICYFHLASGPRDFTVGSIEWLDFKHPKIMAFKNAQVTRDPSYLWGLPKLLVTRMLVSYF